MSHLLDDPLANVAAALRERRCSAAELLEEALSRHAERGARFDAYKFLDAEGARRAARQADRILAGGSDPPPLCGIPVSVKDLYGVEGLPTFAGTARRLPEAWSRDAWLVGELRRQGAVFTGKTHTVEMAYGAVGINPHWGTPWNPWDADRHRIPGGSSCGAGVSLWEGSALIALGTDTGGSIRIPASMTGTVGHKTTKGRWPTDGVVPLSSTLDTVGALTRRVRDSVYFFGSVDPAWGDPAVLLRSLSRGSAAVRVGLPRCGIWRDCQADVAEVLHDAMAELQGAGWSVQETQGGLLDEAGHLYMHGGMAGAECRDFLERDLPGWLEQLHPTVGSRLERTPSVSDGRYAAAVSERGRLAAAAPDLFHGVRVLALPTAILTPPCITDLEPMERYLEVNAAALRPTCPVSMLDLCAVSLPVGLDRSGMPVGLQIVAPAGEDETALSVALAAERILGDPLRRLDTPPALRARSEEA
ncbi:MAG: amidase [Gemmatimonadota bacterium]